MVAWVVILASAVVILRALPTAQIMTLVQGQVETLGPWGPPAFGAAYIAAGLLFVPGSALTLAAGAIFGLWAGLVTVSLASTATAGLAFLIARYAARARVQAMAERNRMFGAIDTAIGRGGWKVVALLRLSPAVPFSAGNYLFGLTSVRFWPYLIASWIAMLPGTFLYVYLGFIGGKSAQAGADGGTSIWQWVLMGLGLVATVVVTKYVTLLARKALKETAVEQDSRNERGAEASEARRRPLWPLVASAAALVALAACAQLNKGRLAGLFGPPEATLQETYEPKPGGPVFDHSQFDALLSEHVVEGGSVDYEGLRKDAAALDAYIASLESPAIKELGRDERLALLINAYNAFTLRLILDYYPVDSITDIPGSQRWDARRWNIGGELYSLNEIEHELIRPNFAEPRIHFALVCAAVGCPPLRVDAYTGARLEEQLTEQAQYVHSHSRWMRVHPDRDLVELTSLYDWYGGDFEQVADSVLDYASRYSPQLAALMREDKTPKVRFLEYDWKLNSIANRREGDS